MDTKRTDEEVKAIIVEGLAEASRFANAYHEQHGQHYPMGFGWVTIRPAKGQFAKVLKAMGLGVKADVGGGWMVWNPSKHTTQTMATKYEGAQAFAQHLRKYGVNATAYQRMD